MSCQYLPVLVDKQAGHELREGLEMAEWSLPGHNQSSCSILSTTPGESWPRWSWSQLCQVMTDLIYHWFLVQQWTSLLVPLLITIMMMMISMMYKPMMLMQWAVVSTRVSDMRTPEQCWWWRRSVGDDHLHSGEETRDWTVLSGQQSRARLLQLERRGCINMIEIIDITHLLLNHPL